MANNSPKPYITQQHIRSLFQKKAPKIGNNLKKQNQAAGSPSSQREVNIHPNRQEGHPFSQESTNEPERKVPYRSIISNATKNHQDHQPNPYAQRRPERALDTTPPLQTPRKRCCFTFRDFITLILFLMVGYIFLHLTFSGNSSNPGFSLIGSGKKDPSKRTQQTGADTDQPATKEDVKEVVGELLASSFKDKNNTLTPGLINLGEKLNPRVLDVIKNSSIEQYELVKKLYEDSKISKAQLEELRNWVAFLKQHTPSETYQTQLELFRMNTKTELITDHSKTCKYVGKNRFTRVAVIDQLNYLICTDGLGYALVVNGKVRNEAPFDAGAKTMYNVVYASHVNAYFLILDKKIYRKTLDGLHPELWVQVSGGFGWNIHTPLIYSPKNKRIFTVKGTKTIAVIDPSKKGVVDFELTVAFASHIHDLRFVGENHEYVVGLTWNRYVFLVKYDASQKKGVLVNSLHYPETVGCRSRWTRRESSSSSPTPTAPEDDGTFQASRCSS